MARRVLRRGLLLLSIPALILILLIAAGVTDPKPIGVVQWQTTPGARTIPAQEQVIEWLDAPAPGASFTVQATAVFQQGATDARYGLRLADADQTVDVLVSPSGYVAIRAGDQDLFPYQLWPHARAGVNEIWIDVQQTAVTQTAVTVRLNREWLWSGTIETVPTRLGLIGEGFAEMAVVVWEKVSISKP
ncbi:MAG: hypothetical protein IAE79_27755 [Anaerolinea sp.]|nr:hypothetical protein [Anaerolinea sp.]